MCFAKRCCWLFKISVLGALLALVLALLGAIPPYSRSLVSIPFLWMPAILILLISITIYFNVRESFWDEVLKKKAKSKKK